MKDKSQGFSLLELTVVLLILGIVGVVAIPSMQNVRRQEVSRMARVIALDLVEQRNIQKTNNRAEYKLELQDVGGIYNTYKIVKVVGSTETEYVARQANARSLEIEIMGGATTTLVFKDDTMKADSGTDYTDTILEIKIVSDESKATVRFDYVTGRYEIVT